MESPRSASSTSKKRSRCGEGCSKAAKERREAAAVDREGGTSALGGGTINANSVLETPNGDGTLRMLLSDPYVLGCSGCLYPLCIPVFECEGGHLACLTCCLRLHKVCSVCDSSIGDKRCRPVERILESSRLLCENEKNGCKVWFNLRDKFKHESVCIYGPFSCPILNCNFKGPINKYLNTNQLMHRPRYEAVVFERLRSI